MRAEYTAVVKQDGDWWIGWVEEVPGVNCQERSLEELKETLRQTLKEALESNSPQRRSTVPKIQVACSDGLGSIFRGHGEKLFSP